MITKEMLRAAKLIAAWPAGPGRHATAQVFVSYFELQSMAAVDFLRLCDVEDEYERTILEEREACAKLCDAERENMCRQPELAEHTSGQAKRCAEAIRARRSGR